MGVPMKEQTKSIWQKQVIFAAIATLVLMFAAQSLAVAQEVNFKKGERVEADMSNYSHTRDWQKATIVEVMMWQGNISGIYVKTDDGRLLTLGEKNVRKFNEAVKKVDGNDQTKPALTVQNGDCGVGTRVQGEFGGGGIGTIKEIGTEPPHVGWYRITFDWDPKVNVTIPRSRKLELSGQRPGVDQAASRFPTPAPVR